MPSDALPSTARGDAHRLVVVTVTATGGERVTEPERIGRGDLVGDVAEAGGSLVGGDDQIGVIVIEAHGVGRRHDRAPNDVVREVEQTADELAITGDAFRTEL